METRTQLRKRRKVNVESHASRMKHWQQWGDIKWEVTGTFRIYKDDGVITISHVRYYKAPEPEREQWLNSYQYFLYRRAMFGLEVYSQDELDHMHREKKKRIYKTHEHAREVLNEFLQRVMIHLTDRLFVILFPLSRVTRQLQVHHTQPVRRDAPVDPKESDPDYICTLNPSMVGIKRMTVVKLMVINHVLPQEFFDLSVKDDPRTKKLQQQIREPLDTL